MSTFEEKAGHEAPSDPLGAVYAALKMLNPAAAVHALDDAVRAGAFGENGARYEEALRDALRPEAPADPFAAHWRELSACGFHLGDEPPPRKWLLKTSGNDGALPLGKCGVLAAGGGTGKTIALCQLALAVATGGFWLGTFKAVAPGRVLLGLAEEDLEEVHRRLYRAANALGLDRDQREEAAKRIVALPLAGTPVALTESDERGNVTESSALVALRERLAEGEWRLIVLDPLARWAGEGAETDNLMATRFVQAVESLVRSPGSPTVLVAHHSSKASIAEGAANVRGASGIVDGFRWAATLDKLEDEGLHGVRLSLAKTNYTKRWEPVYLVWGEGESESALVPASAGDRERLENASKKASAAEAETRRINAESRAKNAETKAAAEERRSKAMKSAGPPTHLVDGE